MKPNRFEEMREDMKEQLEEMENKQNETLIFLESKVGLKLFQISIFVVIKLKANKFCLYSLIITFLVLLIKF
jgi:hypothetical protein